MEEAKRILGDTIIDAEETGSRVICNPPPVGTDDDVVILIDNFAVANAKLAQSGYQRDAKNSYRRLVNFHSFKNPNTNINFIITKKRGFFERFKEATWIAKFENLTNKADRVALFEMIVYGTRNKYADIKYEE